MAKKPPIHDVTIDISPHDVRRHAGQCPTANCLALSEPGEILFPKADTDRKEIRYSRRSDNMKYTFRMPKNVYDFIIKWDSGMLPKPIRLVLTDDDLISVQPRAKAAPNRRRQKRTGPPRPRKSGVVRGMPSQAQVSKATKKKPKAA
jgi:hypothetical protein